ncbi:MAG: transketolase C-terminal domain-containing protein [Dehalococcoidia bacterium]|nr:transketolase C-terminal domain-containing protein [Dehalococcoidia bacterium]
MSARENLSMQDITLKYWKIGDNVSLRDAFGRILCHLGAQRSDFFLFDADVAGGTGSKPFVERFPDRVFQFGIAEQNAMAAAAGFTTTKLIPVVNGFAVFAMMRSHEQFRTAVAYPNRNVKVCCSHVGVDVGPDGATAQMLEDLAVARSIPNVTVVVPADANEFMKAFPKVLDHQGPVYMRIGRSPAPVIFNSEHEFEIGKATVVHTGKDVSIVATGVMVARSLEAAQILKGKGISARVINLSTIKPLDEDTLLAAARETGAVVTAEDHNRLGGMGGAVCELLAQNHPVPVEMVAVNDRFGCSGEPADLAAFFGLTSGDITEAAIKAILRKVPKQKFHNRR